MKRKKKLFMTFSALCLVVALGVFGIFAVKTLNMSVGGNITFSAEGLDFSISKGTFETTAGAEYPGVNTDNTKLQAFAMNTNTKESDIATQKASWSGLNLTMSSLGDVVLVFTVTNNMTTTDIVVTFSVTLGNNLNNNMGITVPTGEDAIVGAATASGSTSKEMAITFNIFDTNINAGLTGFTIDVNFAKPIDVASISYMTFTPTQTGETTCKVSNCSSATGDVVIPAFINLDGDTCLVTEIAENAFKDNKNITSVKISDTVQKIGGWAFAYCDNLTSVVISDSVTNIDYAVFAYCPSLTSVVIGKGVTKLSAAAFYLCSNLTNITIHSGVTEIGKGTFYSCTSLTSIIIPDTVTTIGEDAFNNCTGLKSIAIGNGITTIDDWAFQFCTSLTDLTIKSELPPSLASVNVLGYTSENLIIYVPQKIVQTYKDANIWSSFKEKIQAISI